MNLSREELNASSTTADWQRGQTFCFSAVCLLTSPKSAPISALTCPSAASCTASPLRCQSPGTHCADSALRLVGLLIFHSLKSSTFVIHFRLAHLLGHDFILKPQWDFGPCATADVWLSRTPVAKALMDPLLIEASCPLALSGTSCLSWQTCNCLEICHESHLKFVVCTETAWLLHVVYYSNPTPLYIQEMLL